MSEEKQISDPPPIYARWVRADYPDATDARVGRLWRAASEGDRAFWADLVGDLGKLREIITEILAEFGQHYCDDPACESAVRIPTVRLTKWRERAGLPS